MVLAARCNAQYSFKTTRLKTFGLRLVVSYCLEKVWKEGLGSGFDLGAVLAFLYVLRKTIGMAVHSLAPPE